MKLYVCKYEIKYFSPRYLKWITVPEGYLSDGATFASDIWSEGWWIHDILCDSGMFDDGSDCTPWQASCILGDVLKGEGRRVRAFTWKWATFLFGPHKLGRLRQAVKAFVARA
jgi:hypothetical protein